MTLSYMRITTTHTKCCLPALTTEKQRSLSLVFDKWAAQRNIRYPKIEISMFEKDLRGMRAKEVLKRDDVVVTLPRESAIQIEPTTPSPTQFPKDVWKTLPWFMKLGIKLNIERIAGKDSFYSGYISSLPDEIDLPCLWPDEDIQKLKCTRIEKAIRLQKEEWNRFVNNVVVACPEMGLERDSLLQCLALVRSRAFSGPFIGSKLQDRIRLGLIVVVLAAINIAVSGWNSIEPTLNAILAVSTFNFLYEWFLSQRLKVYLLAPGVDFMNHNSHVTCDLSYDYFLDGYSVQLDRDYEQGEQVFISYGKKSNDELLQYFGFVQPNNPYDFVEIEDGWRVLLEICEKKINVAENITNHIAEYEIEVFREGFNENIFNMVKRWVEQAGAEKTLVFDILIELCEIQMFRLEQSLPEGLVQREVVIKAYLIEKISILKTCISILKDQNNLELYRDRV